MGEVVATKKVLVAIPCTDSVERALSTLARFNISSAPVSTTPGSWLGAGGSELVVNGVQMIGIVSVLDLFAFLFAETAAIVDPFDDAISSCNSLAIVKRLAAPVTDAIGCTNESLSLWSEDCGRSLFRVLEAVSKGVHRTLVVGTGSDSARLLTQTDVVRFIRELSRRGAPTLRELFLTPLERLGLGESASAQVRPEADERAHTQVESPGPELSQRKCSEAQGAYTQWAPPPTRPVLVPVA